MICRKYNENSKNETAYRTVAHTNTDKDTNEPPWIAISLHICLILTDEIQYCLINFSM